MAGCPVRSSRCEYERLRLPLAQAIWRKVQDIGLRRAYIHDNATHRYVKELMAMQLPPAEHIDPVFQVLKTKATSSKLQHLTTYIEDTWINSSVWPPTNWSVYGQIVRTDNDLEGWHTRINTSTRPQTGLYLLVEKLHLEATAIPLTIRLLSGKKIRCHQRSDAKEIQDRLEIQWNLYKAGEKTAMRLLKACASIYGPSN